MESDVRNAQHLKQVEIVSEQLLSRSSLLWKRHDVLHILEGLAQVVMYSTQLCNPVMVLD